MGKPNISKPPNSLDTNGRLEEVRLNIRNFADFDINLFDYCKITICL